jgi:hypothetical protein
LHLCYRNPEVARRRLNEDVQSGKRIATLDDKELSKADWANLDFRIDRWRRCLVEREPINLLISDPIEARPAPTPVFGERPATPAVSTLAATEATDTATFATTVVKQLAKQWVPIAFNRSREKLLAMGISRAARTLADASANAPECTGPYQPRAVENLLRELKVFKKRQKPLRQRPR